MFTDAKTKSCVAPVLSNSLLAEVANTLLALSQLPAAPARCGQLAQDLLQILARRLTTDSAKGNASGGPGAPPAWYVVVDEGAGSTLLLRGMAAVAAQFGTTTSAMRARLAAAGGAWGTTRQTHSGEWAVTVRRATAAEIAALAAPADSGTAVA